MASKSQPYLSVIVRKRTGVVFSGDVEAVSCINAKGPFDILPEHANFVTKIMTTIIFHEHHQKSRVIPISSGILHVRANHVAIYVGI